MTKYIPEIYLLIEIFIILIRVTATDEFEY